MKNQSRKYIAPHAANCIRIARRAQKSPYASKRTRVRGLLVWKRRFRPVAPPADVVHIEHPSIHPAPKTPAFKESWKQIVRRADAIEDPAERNAFLEEERKKLGTVLAKKAMYLSSAQWEALRESLAAGAPVNTACRAIGYTRMQVEKAFEQSAFIEDFKGFAEWCKAAEAGGLTQLHLVAYHGAVREKDAKLIIFELQNRDKRYQRNMAKANATNVNVNVKVSAKIKAKIAPLPISLLKQMYKLLDDYSTKELKKIEAEEARLKALGKPQSDV